MQQTGRAPAALRRAEANPRALWATAGVVYVGAAFLVLPFDPSLGFPLGDYGAYVLGYAGAGVLATLIVVPAVFGDGVTGWPRRFLGRPLLRWLGVRSYGIYLWHFPVLYALDRWGAPGWGPASLAFPLVGAMTVALTCVLAALSYRWVERPLMRRAARPWRRPALARPQVLTLDSPADGDRAPDTAGGLAGGLPSHA